MDGSGEDSAFVEEMMALEYRLIVSYIDDLLTVGTIQQHPNLENQLGSELVAMIREMISRLLLGRNEKDLRIVKVFIMTHEAHAGELTLEDSNWLVDLLYNGNSGAG